MLDARYKMLDNNSTIKIWFKFAFLFGSILFISSCDITKNIEKQEEIIPILGICVGLQIMSYSSEEGDLSGLGWIPGKVKKFDESIIHIKPKLPHMGWNKVNFLNETQLSSSIPINNEFYFLHSYFFSCVDNGHCSGVTEYCVEFQSVVSKNNVYGVQFHPEKSHSDGLLILKNFAIIKESNV